MSKRHRYCPDRDNCRAPRRGKCICQCTSFKRLYTSEYDAWRSMKCRCFNSNYKTYYRYGGRGITVCTEWRNSFKSFFDHVGPKPDPAYELDRIDSNGHYEPGNVRWTTKLVNANNKDCVKTYTINGEEGTLPYWESRSGRNRKTIWRRLKDGWPPAWAVMLDPLPHKYRYASNGLAEWAQENGL